MNPFGEPRTRSLLLDALDWMLAPLAVLWPAAVAISYAVGLSIADGPFDRELRDRVDAIIEEYSRTPARAGVSLHTLDRIRTDPVEHSYAQILDAEGRAVAGDSVIPGPGVEDCPVNEVAFRNAWVEDREVRIACRRIGAGADSVSFQVAEYVDRRREYATQTTLTVMAVVMVLVPITVALVMFALYYGLAPIRRLRASIEARRPQDLSPLPLEGSPVEIEPLLKSLNEQLDRVRSHLEMQHRFVADAAHQLRTPLAALKTQAQVGKSAKTIAEAGERLEHIAESAEHLARLANQLLALARVDEARPSPPAPVDLGAALRTACHDASTAAIAKSIRIHLEVPDAALTVRGDAGLLHELFANLLDNAVRYTPAGGAIEVRAFAASAPVVEVEDTGPGIPEAEREMVFERFYRVLGTGAEGSGLGLAIVRSIALRHGASVTAGAGREGRGALFRVAFP